MSSVKLERLSATVPVLSTDSSSTSNDLPNRTVRTSIGAALSTTDPLTRLAAPSATARELIQELHDEMRADIPDIKVFGKRLLPAPWSQDRIDRIAALLDEHSDSRIDAAVEAALLRQSKSRRRAA